jgi:branched-subunit amino acid transport protein AzlD
MSRRDDDLIGYLVGMIVVVGLVVLTMAWPFMALYGPNQSAPLPRWEQELGAVLWYPLLVVSLVQLCSKKSTLRPKSTGLWVIVAAFVGLLINLGNNSMGAVPFLLGALWVVFAVLWLARPRRRATAVPWSAAVRTAAAPSQAFPPRATVSPKPLTSAVTGPAAPTPVGIPGRCDSCGKVVENLPEHFCWEALLGALEPEQREARPNPLTPSSRPEVRQNDPVAPDIATVWTRIQRCQGQTFTQKLGREFTYVTTASQLIPNRTNRLLPKSDFAKALRLVPLTGPGQIQHLQGPSYVYAVLMDRRIRLDDW